MNQFLSDLGLNPNKQYNTNELKDQWRKKCKEHHPDKGGDPKKFREVTHAFKMLTDPEYQVQEAKKKPERDLHIQMIIPIKFDDAFFGRTILVNFNRVRVNENFDPVEDQTNQQIESLKIEIPPASFEGSEFSFPGKGVIMGEASGNCVVKIQVLQHRLYQVERREGEISIVSEAKIPMDMALKGGVLEVPTMYGLQSLKIPPGTQPGERLCVGDFGPERKRKHYVSIQPMFPSKEELKKGEAWKGLGIQWTEEELKLQEQDNELYEIFEKLMKGGVLGTIRFK